MSATADAMKWFRMTFGEAIEEAVAGTPFNLDLLTAIAYQETGYIWQGLYKNMSVPEVLKLCVGDTLDAPNRSAFPKNKAALLAASNGQAMFDVARSALVAMAAHVPSYKGAASKPNKFCHGYGIFQYDIQFFKTDPGYFLNHGWYEFDGCLKKAITELTAALKRAYPGGKTSLTPTESVYVAIAYNAGHVNVGGGFKQGFKDDSGQYYGEMIWSYLNTAATLPHPTHQPTMKLIVADHAGDGPDGWAYQTMTTAAIENDRFVLNKAELAGFLGITIPGPDRQRLIDMLNAAKVQYIVNDKHANDADNPTMYVFVTQGEAAKV